MHSSFISRRAVALSVPLLAANSGFLIPPAAASSADDVLITRLPQPGRLVAVGDLHGDATAFRRVLEVTKLFDEGGGGWIGGDATLVQIGDVLDRGDDELELLSLLSLLKREAALAGGRVITMLGNHEVLNAAGVSVYASPRAAAGFDDRATAFRVGGELARELATWPVACVIGDTAFCHGGLTSEQARRGLAAGNREAAAWLRGESGPTPPELLWPSSPRSPRSPLWMRDLSEPPMAEPSAAACSDLSRALAEIGAKRLVVGHTVQPRISCGCDCSVYRIDVGLSRAMGVGGSPQALEVGKNGDVRVLS